MFKAIRKVANGAVKKIEYALKIVEVKSRESIATIP